LKNFSELEVFMMEKKKLAGDIRRIRKKRGLTQKQLGELCGIDEANIRKYESGKQNPKIETIEKIAGALQCSMDIPDDLRLLDDAGMADNSGFLKSNNRGMKDGKASGAVLLVNMPDKCKDCTLYFELGSNCMCRLNYKLVSQNEKPDWCPLVLLPKKKELSCDNWDYDIRASAWNSCIDSITAMQKQGGAAGLKGSSK